LHESNGGLTALQSVDTVYLCQAFFNMSDEGCVFLGDAAGLSACRVGEGSNSSSRELLQAALEQLLDGDREERILCGPLAAQATFIGLDNEEEDDRKMEEEEVRGTVLVTSEVLLFWTADRDTGKRLDLRADAVCIDLHALTQDEPPSVYIQMTNSSAEDNPLELTLQPVNQEACQSLFEAISKLISLHPIDPNENGDGRGMFLGDTDEMVWAPPTNGLSADDDAPEPTEEERDQMLARLDNMLIVPPEFERPDTDEGQFDDAEEEEEEEEDIL
jgi:hypothetical protein